MNRFELAERISEIWSRSRSDAGKSREYMAKMLGVSKKTIQNWEEGLSSPSVIRCLEWFDCLNMNPLPYVLQTLYPKQFHDISHADSDERIEEALEKIVADLPSDYKRRLLFFLYADHGSSPLAMLDLSTAHLQAPLETRINIAQSVATNYEIALAKNNLRSPNHIQPNMDNLHDAIYRGKEAVVHGENRYNGL